MFDILHRFGVDASAHEVYESLATIDGLASWWTREVSGDPNPGGTLGFSFGGSDRSFSMEVIATEPDVNVAWRCVAGLEGGKAIPHPHDPSISSWH